MTKQQSTCFTTNNPLCSVRELSKDICQASIEIKEYFAVLSSNAEIVWNKLTRCTKNSQGNEKHVQTFGTLQSIFDNQETCWGCHVSVNGTKMVQLV